MTSTPQTTTLHDTAAELSATAADIAANITEARACPGLIGHAREQLDILAAAIGDATDSPVPYTLTPKAHAALEDAAQADWEAWCDATWWETAAVVEDYAAWKAANYPDEAEAGGGTGCAECGRDWSGCECWKLDASRPATTTEIYDTGWEN